MSIVAFQPEFRPALPVVFGAKDYREFRAIPVEMGCFLVVTARPESPPYLGGNREVFTPASLEGQPRKSEGGKDVYHGSHG